MKLRLPASFQDLTLRHLMTLETETDPVKRVQAVTGHSFAELRKMPHKLIVEANAHLDTLQANGLTCYNALDINERLSA